VYVVVRLVAFCCTCLRSSVRLLPDCTPISGMVAVTVAVMNYCSLPPCLIRALTRKLDSERLPPRSRKGTPRLAEVQKRTSGTAQIDHATIQQKPAYRSLRWRKLRARSV
jgi:hypothetical protein